MQGAEAVLDFAFPDTGEAVTVDLRKSVMFPRAGAGASPTVKLTIARKDFNRMLAEQVRLMELLGSGAAKLERSEEHTSELQSLMSISYAVYCLNNKHDIHKST